MTRAAAKLVALLKPPVEGMGFELLGIEQELGKRTGLIRLYIDKEGGISVEDCEQVSRQVSAVLDVEDPVPGEYNLEVSSPGLDRPLFEFEHFERFAGEEVKVRLRAAVDGRRHFSGVIGPCADGIINLTVDGEVVDLRFEDIANARLVPKF